MGGWKHYLLFEIHNMTYDKFALLSVFVEGSVIIGISRIHPVTLKYTGLSITFIDTHGYKSMSILLGIMRAYGFSEKSGL